MPNEDKNKDLYVKEINFNYPENKIIKSLLTEEEIHHIQRHIPDPGYTTFIASVDRQMNDGNLPCFTCLKIAQKLGHI